MKKYILHFIILFLSLFSCTKENDSPNDSELKKGKKSVISYNRENYSKSNLISISEFNNISETQLVIIDIRKNEEFEKGHIKNAQNIWRSDIRNEQNDIEGLMASKEKMESLLSILGATPESLIVVYDAKGNPDAARLWWILKYYGHENVAILDGGLPVPITIGRESQNMTITTNIFSPETTDYKFTNPINESYYASKELVLKAIEDTNYIIIDTRCMAEYFGKEKKGNADRAGKIPNSILINYDENISYSTGMNFKTEKLLIDLYKNINRNKKIITYCQSGVRSALTTFVLTKLLGYKNVKNYDGSWLEWSNDSTLPIQQDSLLMIE